MSNEVQRVVVSGPTIGCGLISTILFFLKIFSVAPVADWSWWLVTIFWWGPLAVVLAIIAACVIGTGGFVGIATLIDKIRGK